MKPCYSEGFTDVPISSLLADLPWVRETETRQECFMSDPIRSYTYGKGRGVRTYTSIPYAEVVMEVMTKLNYYGAWNGSSGTHGRYNACFLNRYDDQLQHLGWHADDHEAMDHDHPIAVVSFGEPREIWWRPFGMKGEIPAEQKQLLAHGSIFEMPPGFQHEYEHRIPKGSRNMGPRVSMTFRRFL